jgi:hypothetical protein
VVVDVADDAFSVDTDDRAVRGAVGIQETVPLRHGAVGIEVAEQLEFDAPFLLKASRVQVLSTLTPKTRASSPKRAFSRWMLVIWLAQSGENAAGKKLRTTFLPRASLSLKSVLPVPLSWKSGAGSPTLRVSV